MTVNRPLLQTRPVHHMGQPRVAVIVPYRAGEPHRDRAWAWCLARMRAMLPADWACIMGTDNGGEHPGHFNHPYAINVAADVAIEGGADVLVVADCDTTFSDPGWLVAAALEVGSGQHPWALPARYVKLTEDCTASLTDEETIVDCNLSGAEADPPPYPFETEWVGDGVSWSGMVIVPAEAFRRVGGYDERFAWWGADDVCFGLSMDTLWGQHHRAPGAVVHLWHPAPEGETYGHQAHKVQAALTEKYKAAAGNLAAMRNVRFG